MSYLPDYYQTSEIQINIAQAEGLEFDKLRQAISETLAQFFVRTATWTLDDWEEELGLTPANNQPDSERQARIVSKIRGYGTATISLIGEVAQSYDNGKVAAIQDHAAYKVYIRFIDTLGIPPNLDDCKKALREIVPAHLDIEYEFSYLIYNLLTASGKTYDQIKAAGITYDQFRTWTPV